MRRKFAAFILSVIMLTGLGVTSINADPVVKKDANESIEIMEKLDEIQSMLKEKSLWNKKFELIHNLKIFINGGKRSYDYLNANEKFPEAINYNGELYVPAKLFSEMVDKELTYDKPNNAIYFGKKPEQKYIAEVLEPFKKEGYGHQGELGDYVTVLDKKYYNYIAFKEFRDSDNYLKYELDSNYNKISGKVSALDDAEHNQEYKIGFLADGKLIKTITVKKGDKPKDFSVNLEGVNVLTFQVKIKNGNSKLFISDHPELAVGLVDIILE